MIMREALGTSTPTSITVVATSNFRSPALKASMTRDQVLKDLLLVLKTFKTRLFIG